MKIVIGCLLFLSALMSATAGAIPPSVAVVYIDMGTINISPGGGQYCGLTSQLPPDLDQVNTLQRSGPLTFGSHAYTRQNGPNAVALCVDISHNFTAFGTFSGTEVITLQRNLVVTVNVNGNYAFGNWRGIIYPKYHVLGVDYAPPGSRSSVTYSANFSRGGSNSLTETFGNSTSVSVTTSLKFGVEAAGANHSTTITSAYAQQGETQTGSSWSLNATGGQIVYGPASSAAGIDHNYDIVWIWLNPAVELTLTGPASFNWDGYAYNAADPANQMDVLYLYVFELKNPALIPANVASRLARTWDVSGVGGLTNADYQSILAADPFATNPLYDPNMDSSGRFSSAVGRTFDYRPAGAGGLPVTEFFETTAQTSNTNTSTSQDSRSIGFSIDNSVHAKFKVGFELNLRFASTWTTTTRSSTTNTTGGGQRAAFSITGPEATDNYTGPTAIQIWRDNIYGSYMFYGVQ
jgi:hypothetical protein